MKIMENVLFTNQTRTLGKPEKWVEEYDGPVKSISVFDYHDDQTGLPVMMTGWRPNAQELALLNAGGFIAMRICDIYGGAHPMTQMSVEPLGVVRQIDIDTTG